MSDVVVDQQVNSGVWPTQFADGWIEVVYDNITCDTVASLHIDDRNLEGTVFVNPDRNFELPLPAAYISWEPNGTCKEIYVGVNYRRQGIGTMMCAWARSYLLKENIIFSAPSKMSSDASAMFYNICNTYGEQFNNPEDAPILRGYGYWGYLV